MAKIKYDLSEVETRTNRVPPKGTYKAKVFKVTDRSEQGKNDLKVGGAITEGKFKSVRLWSYLSFNAQAA